MVVREKEAMNHDVIYIVIIYSYFLYCNKQTSLRQVSIPSSYALLAR